MTTVNTESGKFEKFINGASPSMLNLTDNFIEKLSQECKQRGLSLRVSRQDAYTIICVIADEMYFLKNDGIEASWGALY